MAQKNLYSNITLIAPDGEILSHVPEQRANWYIRKNLATWDNAKTLRLKFEPKSRTPFPDWYYVNHKNRCSVCGNEDLPTLEKHHIVPACFRVHFPEALKSRRCFDLTLVCDQCHDDYERYASKFKSELISEAGLIPYEKTHECIEARRTIKAIMSVLKNGHLMNEVGKANCIHRINEFLGSKEFSEADALRLNDEISNRQTEIFRQTVENLQPYEDFIVRWRRHFVEFAKPKFLDPSWLKDLENVS